MSPCMCAKMVLKSLWHGMVFVSWQAQSKIRAAVRASMAGDGEEDEDRAARDEEGSDDPPARGRGRGKGRGRKGRGKGRGRTGGKSRGHQAEEEPTEEQAAKKQKVGSEPKQSVGLAERRGIHPRKDGDEPEKTLDQPDETMAEVPQDSQQPLHGCEVPTPAASAAEPDEDRHDSEHDATPKRKPSKAKAKAKNKKHPVTPKRKTKSLVSPKKADRGSKEGEDQDTGKGETASMEPQASPKISKSAKKRKYIQDTFPAELLHTHACIPVLCESDMILFFC